MSRSFLFWLLLLLLWLIFAWWVCKNYLCGIAPVAAAAPAAIGCDRSLNVSDGKSFDLSSGDNIRFLNSQHTNLPYGNRVSSVLSGLADYLKSNTDKGVTITGNYSADESNNSLLPNLGMARASTIKSILNSLGVSSKQIVLGSDLNSKLCYNRDGRSTEVRNEANKLAGLDMDYRMDTLSNGIGLSVGNLADSGDRLKTIYDRLRANPMTVYFDTNAESLNLNAAQRQDIADITYYLDNVDDGKIEISGHTDNVGNRAYNVNLSQERAEFVKNYFNNRAGLSLAKMDAAGYGPDKPKATNSTAEGKAQNRRVEVTFK
jgi:outer membrane protein OmpA-like peptidoglycan-associated protein